MAHFVSHDRASTLDFREPSAGGDATPHAPAPRVKPATDRGVAEKPFVLLMEPRILLRDCICRCLETATGLSVETAASIDECLDRTASPSLILISRQCKAEQDGTEQEFRLLAQKFPSTPVVLIGDGDTFDQVTRVIHYGGRGYIPTDTPLAVAVEAIQLVRAGGVYVPGTTLLNARTSAPPSGGTATPTLGMFTARQAAVVEALRTGKANKIIAYELNMRESTVKVHVRNIMKRLKAKNRTEVAYLAGKLLKSGDT